MKKALPLLCLSAMGALAGLLLRKSPGAGPPAPTLSPARSLPAPPPPGPASPGNVTDHRLLRERECLALAESDPLAAMDLALAEDLCAVDPGLPASLLLQSALRDFAAAHAWARQLEPGDWRDDLLARLACLRAQTDPLAAARIAVSDIPPGRARDEAVVSVIHQWALRDAEAARLWAESLPPREPLQNRALAEIDGLGAPRA